MTVDEVVKTNKDAGNGRSSRRRNRAEAAKTSIQGREKDRPTPGRRENGGSKNGNILTRIFRPIVEYFSTTRAELGKVTWPTRQESTRLSGIVLGVTAAFSVVLGLLDFLYGQLFRLGFQTPVIFVIFGALLLVVVGGGSLVLRRRGSL